jgi:peptidoglycan hydrolase-like protein with peptidoglycan-binding domain
MKKYLVYILAFVVMAGAGRSWGQVISPEVTAIPGVAIQKCWSGGPVLFKYGMRDEDIKLLQEMLAQDKTIYPEGLATGFFGQLTQNAVKRLQKLYDFPETGVVDDKIAPIIFPCFELKVTYPNGGESFKTSETMKISWEVSMPVYETLKTVPDRPVLQLRAIETQDNLKKVETVYPLPPVLSIDLIEEISSGLRCQLLTYPVQKCPPEKKIVFHIRNVSLQGKGSSSSIEWLIPASISESNNYKIRISSGTGAVNPKCPDCPVIQGFPSPRWQVFDESDGTFSISGGPLLTASATPLPAITPQPDLYRLRDEVTEMIKKLQVILEQLNKLLGL